MRGAPQLCGSPLQKITNSRIITLLTEIVWNIIACTGIHSPVVYISFNTGAPVKPARGEGENSLR
jgi:hypothetical protein